MQKKVCLGDLATYINGYAFKPSDWGQNGLPIIRIQNLTGNAYEVNYFSGNLDKRYFITNGDVLISWSASIGVYEWQNGDAWLNQHIFKVKFDKENVDKKYFQYAVGYVLEKSLKFAHGSTMKHLTKKVFDSLQVPYYDMDTQRQIVAKLAKIDKAIKYYEEIFECLDELVKSRFVEMFGDLRINPCGWKIQSFADLTDLITDGEHATPRRVPKGIYLLSARNVLNHSIQLDDVDYIDEEEYKRIAKRVVPKEGDVLISCSGSVGRCCSVPAGLKFQMVRSAALLRFKSFINHVFAEYMITSDYLQGQINSAKTASSQANLFQGRIAKLKGFAPPIDLQKNFADFVAHADKSKLAVQQSIEMLQTLKEKLMQDYFG